MPSSTITEKVWIHRILVKTEVGAEEAIKRLRVLGHQAEITHNDPRYGIAIDWSSTDRDIDLSCLRPDILPPLKLAV